MLPNLGPLELMFIMGIAVLLFGKRLPEVGRSLGRGIVEFKKGLNGVGDEFDSASSSSRYSSNYGSSSRAEDYSSGGSAYSDDSVPKFELPGTASSSSSSSSSTSSSAPTPQMEYQPPPPHD
jgi:sec-independent protein translocase protein TatA